MITATPAQVFNLPLFELFLVLDLRPEEAFRASHVVTAVSFPAPLVADVPEAAKLAALGGLLAEMALKGTLPDSVSSVVLCVDGTAACAAHAEWLDEALGRRRAEVLQLVPQGARGEEDADGEGADTGAGTGACTTASGADAPQRKRTAGPAWVAGRVDGFATRLFTLCECVLCIEYNVFAAAFPSLCGPDLSVCDMKPLPLLATESIFLGGRAFDPSEEALRSLGITHVVTHDPQLQDGFAGFLGNKVLQGQANIEFLVCSVRDDSAADMAACWATSIAFIDRAIAQGGRVLVHFYGRSRSSSIVMAWLVRRHHWSYDQALEYMRDAVTASIDASLTFPEQLSAWGAERGALAC
jgi:hypothetical protein